MLLLTSPVNRRRLVVAQSVRYGRIWEIFSYDGARVADGGHD